MHISCGKGVGFPSLWDTFDQSWCFTVVVVVMKPHSCIVQKVMDLGSLVLWGDKTGFTWISGITCCFLSSHIHENCGCWQGIQPKTVLRLHMEKNSNLIALLIRRTPGRVHTSTSFSLGWLISSCGREIWGGFNFWSLQDPILGSNLHFPFIQHDIVA